MKHSDGGYVLPICQGETILVPACVRTVRIVPEERITLLESWV